MKTRQSILFAGLLLLLCAAISLATPNFSGEWKMNASKSDFGQMPPPSSVVQKITHEDPSLKFSSTWTGDQGEMTIDATYTTDGKECANKSPMGESKSNLKWDGDTLVIETKADFQGNSATITSRWALSEDGKILTEKTHFSGSMGEGDMTVVYDKQ
jgi:hypothetical protein